MNLRIPGVVLAVALLVTFHFVRMWVLAGAVVGWCVIMAVSEVLSKGGASSNWKTCSGIIDIAFWQDNWQSNQISDDTYFFGFWVLGAFTWVGLFVLEIWLM